MTLDQSSADGGGPGSVRRARLALNQGLWLPSSAETALARSLSREVAEKVRPGESGTDARPVLLRAVIAAGGDIADHDRGSPLATASQEVAHRLRRYEREPERPVAAEDRGLVADYAALLDEVAARWRPVGSHRDGG